MPHPRTLRGRDIVCVGFADWDTELWTNQHHLMSRLAREQPRAVRRVARAAPAPARRPRPARGSCAGCGAASRRRGRATGCTCSRRSCCRFTATRARARAERAPAAGARAPRDAPARVRSEPDPVGLRARRPRCCSTRSAPSLVVYHCVDDIAAQAGHRRAPLPRRRGALRRPRRPRAGERARRWPSACATLSSNVLVRAQRRRHRAVRDARSSRARSTRRSPRCRSRGSCSRARSSRPSSTSTLLIELARARPDWSFALVGPVGPGDPRTDVSALAAEPNVHLLGAAHLRRAARRPARRRRRPDPLRAQRADATASSR